MRRRVAKMDRASDEAQKLSLCWPLKKEDDAFQGIEHFSITIERKMHASYLVPSALCWPTKKGDHASTY